MLKRRFLLEALAEKLRQVVVEVLVYKNEVFTKVAWKRLNVVEHFPKVFFYFGKYASQLYIAKPRYKKESHWVVLVSY